MSQPPHSVVTFPWPDASVWRKWLLSAVLIAVILYLAYAVREIWVPLGLAFLIATVLDPVVDRMEARGWKRGRATIAIFGTFLIILVGVIYLATPYVIAQGADLQKKFETFFPDNSHAGIMASFHKMRAPDWLANVGSQAVGGGQQALQRSTGWITEHGMSFLGNLIWLAIVPVVAFYALRDYHLILAKSLLLVPKKRRADIQTYVVEVGTIFAKYLRGLAIVSILNGIATWLLLWALGVQSSLVLGIIAGILYSVPYIGAMITIVLTAAVAFVSGGANGVNTMLWAVGFSVILHQIIFDQMITPKILGGHVGLHPILSIVALLVGNILLGIVGMVLAVPVAACVQIGVLAALPKLRLDIDIPEPVIDSETSAVQDMDEATKGEPLTGDAVEEMHTNLKAAVDKVEAQAKREETRAAARSLEQVQMTGDE
jgi:predicted PurR-regulated permease PerM